MRPPVLVTPPAAPVVALAELKAHLRVTHDLEDDLITALEGSAVAHLDGWKGILGRAIRSQVWRQEFDAGDTMRLAMPDVTLAVVTGFDAAGAETPVTAMLCTDLRGFWVDVTGSVDLLRVDYTCGLPAQQLPAAQMAVKLLVGHWYANREAVASGAAVSVMPLAVDALVTPLRWVDM